MKKENEKSPKNKILAWPSTVAYDYSKRNKTAPAGSDPASMSKPDLQATETEANVARKRA